MGAEKAVFPANVRSFLAAYRVNRFLGLVPSHHASLVSMGGVHVPVSPRVLAGCCQAGRLAREVDTYRFKYMVHQCKQCHISHFALVCDKDVCVRFLFTKICHCGVETLKILK